MHTRKQAEHIWIDLNHPADFHFFKGLVREWKAAGRKVSLSARDKEFLYALIRAEGWEFRKRGRGSSSRFGKYLHGLYLLVYLLWHLLRRRPAVSLSLSSPYLVLASRILGIPTICYDDTDINPRLQPFIRRADYVVSPASYPHRFHEHHHRIPTFKEMSYLGPGTFPTPPDGGKGAFVRLTRTDSVHHSPGDRLDGMRIARELSRLSSHGPICCSVEEELPGDLPHDVQKASILETHADLAACRAFWGNSATMAAEAAVLGIPAVFVGNEVFSYLHELEEAGMLFCYAPTELDASFQKLEELLADPHTRERHSQLRDNLLLGRTDAMELIKSLISGCVSQHSMFPYILRNFSKFK